MKMNVVDNVR